MYEITQAGILLPPFYSIQPQRMNAFIEAHVQLSML